MNVSDVMTELKKKGNAQTRKTFARHGAPDNMFGVRIGDLKPIAKRIKGEQELACQLYETGNSDAMYLAGLVADGSRMNKSQLDKWAKSAPWQMISEYTVPGVTCENAHARELAMKWIKSKDPKIAACGWATYGGVVATRPDEELDLDEIRDLLKKIEKTVHTAPDRVAYSMNGFVIGVGAYVAPLLKAAKATAAKIGKVEVDMGDTSCKVPLASEAIAKIEKMGRVGRKRKTIKC
jgi:3-methyladenine DNA glycosylase AlkD